MSIVPASPENVKLLSPYREAGEAFNADISRCYEDYMGLTPQNVDKINSEQQRSYWHSSKHTTHIFSQSKSGHKTLEENAEIYNKTVESVIDIVPNAHKTLAPYIRGVTVLPDRMKGEAEAGYYVIAKLEGPDSERLKDERDILLAAMANIRQGLNFAKVRKNSMPHVALYSSNRRAIAEDLAGYIGQNMTEKQVELSPVKLDTVLYYAKIAPLDKSRK